MLFHRDVLFRKKVKIYMFTCSNNSMRLDLNLNKNPSRSSMALREYQGVHLCFLVITLHVNHGKIFTVIQV